MSAAVVPVARYAGSSPVQDDALIIGYAAPSEEQIARGVEVLAQIVAD